MSRAWSLLGLAVLVCGLALWGTAAQAEAEQRRIELAAGEELELACPTGQQLLVRPTSSSAVTVRCDGAGAPTPDGHTHSGVLAIWFEVEN